MHAAATWRPFVIGKQKTLSGRARSTKPLSAGSVVSAIIGPSAPPASARTDNEGNPPNSSSQPGLPWANKAWRRVTSGDIRTYFGRSSPYRDATAGNGVVNFDFRGSSRSIGFTPVVANQAIATSTSSTKSLIEARVSKGSIVGDCDLITSSSRSQAYLYRLIVKKLVASTAAAIREVSPPLVVSLRIRREWLLADTACFRGGRGSGPVEPGPQYPSFSARIASI